MAAIQRNNVNVIGSGEQVLMFAHGYGCNQNMWRISHPGVFGQVQDRAFRFRRIARLENSAIKVVNDSSAASPFVCFEGELRQVLMNLVSNAFDAMRAGGHLIIQSRDATLWRSGARGIRVTVADTGSGMDAETVRHIFELFFSTKGIGGTGLGLWITKDLVEKNKATVGVRTSETTGRNGTVVTLVFP
jgi:signal transduction histidine kinase